MAYRQKGLDAAVQAWIKDSALELNHEPLPQVDAIRQAQIYYGLYRHFELISTQDLSQRTRVVYCVMNFDRGPLFGRFLTYRSDDHGWLVLSFDFSMRPEAILPQPPTSTPPPR